MEYGANIHAVNNDGKTPLALQLALHAVVKTWRDF
jgi:hypothetical protein